MRGGVWGGQGLAGAGAQACSFCPSQVPQLLLDVEIITHVDRKGIEACDVYLPWRIARSAAGAGAKAATNLVGPRTEARSGASSLRAAKSSRACCVSFFFSWWMEGVVEAPHPLWSRRG